MWTATTRAQHKREGLRFASKDGEWSLIVPLLPLLPPPSRVGRPTEWPMREIVHAIFNVLRGSIPWRMLPPWFLPHQTFMVGSQPGAMAGVSVDHPSPGHAGS